jgi:hypothetical protein
MYLSCFGGGYTYIASQWNDGVGRHPERHQRAKMVVVKTTSEGEPYMGKSIRNLSTVTWVGLDLAKRVFHVHAAGAKGEIVVARKLTRSATPMFIMSRLYLIKRAFVPLFARLRRGKTLRISGISSSRRRTQPRWRERARPARTVYRFMSAHRTTPLARRLTHAGRISRRCRNHAC